MITLLLLVQVKAWMQKYYEARRIQLAFMSIFSNLYLWISKAKFISINPNVYLLVGLCKLYSKSTTILTYNNYALGHSLIIFLFP